MHGEDYESAEWWIEREDEEYKPHSILGNLVTEIQNEQSDRYEEYLRLLKAVDQDLTALGETHPRDSSDLKINELVSVAETLHAQLFSSRIVPAITPEFSNYETMRNAQELGWFINGTLEENKFNQVLMPKAGMEMCALGTGFIKSSHSVHEDGDCHVDLERLSPMNVFVPITGQDQPREIHIRWLMDRHAAIAKFCGGEDEDETMFGSKEDRIVALKTSKADTTAVGYQAGSLKGDYVFVWESFRLPSGPKAKDGKRIFWVTGGTLMVEEWNRKRFPIAAFRYGTSLHSFYGQSPVARMMSAQKTYEKLTGRIDRCHDLMGVPKLLVKKGSKINKADLDDEEGTIVEYEGQPPQEWNAHPITSEAYSERDSLPEKMRGLVGISGWQSQLQLPTQLREASGKALEAYEGEGNARHAMDHRNVETGVVDVAMLIIDEAEEAQERGLNVVARATVGRKHVLKLKYKEVRQALGSFEITILPISQLSQSFSARLKELKELKDEGVITNDEYMRVGDFPDVDSEKELASSGEAIIRKNVAWMMKHKKMLQPLPFDNHDLIIKLTTQHINLYRVQEDEFDDEVVSVLSSYIVAASNLKKVQSGAAQPVPGGPPDGSAPMPGPPPEGMPPGMPGEMPMPMEGGAPGELPMGEPMMEGMPEGMPPGMPPEGGMPPM